MTGDHEPPSGKARSAGDPTSAVRPVAGAGERKAPVAPPAQAERPAGQREAKAPAVKPAPKPKPTAAAKPAGPAGAQAKGVTRRRVVWWSVFGFLFACAAASIRFFFPRAIFEPKTRFPIGYPSDYGFGVSTKWQAAQRIWVVRDSGGLYVILARCTHLGCTPDWKEAENKFKCPCHGSGFDTEGVNFEGPAPRPLERLHVELDAQGRIVVDKSKVYGGLTLAEAAEAWKTEGAFLQV